MRDLLRSLEEEGESANAEHIAHSYDGSRLGTSIEPELAGSTELRWDVITEGKWDLKSGWIETLILRTRLKRSHVRAHSATVGISWEH